MESKQKKTGAIIYTRVSTGPQAEHGTSLPCQLEACMKKIAELGLPLVATYEDAGVSGGYLSSRAGMMQAIDDIEQGKVDTLVITNMTRYSRDVEHQQSIKKAVRRAGGRIVFTDMSFDDTPEGDLAFNVNGAFAEYERKVLRQRSINGHRRRAADGIQPQRSRVPYGYHIPTKADVLRGEYPADMLGKYIMVEERAKVVRRIFEEIALGTKSLSGIGYELQQEGIPSPCGKTCWGPSPLQRILTNPVYKGQPVLGKVKRITDETRLSKVSDHTGRVYTNPTYRVPTSAAEQIVLSAPAIVSEETWDQAQEMRRSNQSLRGGNPRRVRMLSGRIFCPECGAPMYVHGTRYICGRHHQALQRMKEHVCSGQTYNVSMVERAVVDAIVSACECPESIAAAYEVFRAQVPAEPTAAETAELTRVEADLKALAQEEADIVRAQIAGMRSGASPDVYASIFADIAARRKDLEDRRGKLSRSNSPRRKRLTGASVSIDLEAFKPEVLSDLRETLTDELVSGADKRNLLAQIVDRVYCTDTGAKVLFNPALFGSDTFPVTFADETTIALREGEARTGPRNVFELH